MTVRGLSRQGNQRIVVADPTGPFTIRARDSVSVRVCATQWADTSTMAASIDIELPCGLLRTFYVKTRVSSSITGDTIDFGDVRLGDTACGRVAIVNNGDRPTDLDKLIATKLDSSFTLDTAALGLPRQIPPGDTVWVDVCVVPRQQGSITRIDSIVSSSGVDAWVVCRARGVRPRVASVVIDWKARRVGSINDTTIVLRNSGDGWCLAEPSLAPASSAFSLSGVPAKGARLDSGDSLLLRASFRPTTRDTFSLESPVSIDWAPHAPVSITLVGVGVMPDIAVQDVNFGTIVVDTQRDTLVDLLTTGYSGGNAELLVKAIRIVGPDSSSFVLPASFLTSVGTPRPLPSRLKDVVVFVPTRLGAHECFVDVDHDA
ncbi:MAG: choice-of-anchor D domain-containing protein, partial [Bacteroidota bacterium]